MTHAYIHTDAAFGYNMEIYCIIVVIHIQTSMYSIYIYKFMFCTRTRSNSTNRGGAKGKNWIQPTAYHQLLSRLRTGWMLWKLSHVIILHLHLSLWVKMFRHESQIWFRAGEKTTFHPIKLLTRCWPECSLTWKVSLPHLMVVFFFCTSFIMAVQIVSPNKWLKFAGDSNAEREMRRYVCNSIWMR